MFTLTQGGSRPPRTFTPTREAPTPRPIHSSLSEPPENLRVPTNRRPPCLVTSLLHYLAFLSRATSIKTQSFVLNRLHTLFNSQFHPSLLFSYHSAHFPKNTRS